MRNRLNEDTSSDLIIYQDDSTGKCYYWNGTELVYLYTNNPNIGDRGDKEFQEREEEERKAQRQKEKEEAQRLKDAGEEYDEEALEDEETEEEKE